MRRPVLKRAVSRYYWGQLNRTRQSGIARYMRVAPIPAHHRTTMHHVNPSRQLRGLRGRSVTRHAVDNASPASDGPYASTLSAAVVGDALRAIARDTFSAIDNTSNSLSDAGSTDSSAAAPDSEDGRETPPPSYAATQTPPPYSEVALSSGESIAATAPGTRGRQAQRRRDLILAMAARRGRDLNQLDPPPSYAVCMGDAEAIGDTDAFTEFARGARTLNRASAQRDVEALLPQRAGRCSWSRISNWMPLTLICAVVFGLSALSVVTNYSQRNQS